MRTRLLLVLCAALALTVGVGAATAGGGNSPNAKKCQKGGWINHVVVGSQITTFKNQGDCVSNAAQGGLLVRIPSLASQPLCESFGGSFGPGPDLIGALSNPVLWVCNGAVAPNTPDPFSTDINRFVLDQALPLAYDCLADGGFGLAWFVRFVGDDPGVANLTCYGSTP